MQCTKTCQLVVCHTIPSMARRPQVLSSQDPVALRMLQQLGSRDMQVRHLGGLAPITSATERAAGKPLLGSAGLRRQLREATELSALAIYRVCQQ